MPRARRYTVDVSATEAARLRAFDNKAGGVKPWPLGPKRTFRKTARSGRFVVEEFAGAAWDATLMTKGKAWLRPDDTVEVVIAIKSQWVGWLLVLGGIMLLALVVRDGWTVLVVGLGFIAAGWFLFIKRPGMDDDLDEIEKVMRDNIRGTWRSGTE